MAVTFRAAVAGVAMSAAVLTLAAGTAAQAANSPGWREVQSLHSGAPANGTNYSAAVAPDSRDLWVLGGTGGISANIVGYPLTEHWDGKSWQRVPGPPRLVGSIYAASASSENNIWALDGYTGCCGSDVLNWNGTRWSDALQVSTGGLSGITAISASNVWAFGSGNGFSGAGAWHFNGQTWTRVTGNASFVATASAASATDIWAIGGTAQESGISIEHYSGKAWSYVRSPSLNGYYEGIRVTSPTSIWITEIAGRANKPYLLHGNGSTWTKTALPGPSLQAPVPDGAGGVWTVVTAKTTVLAVHLTRSGKLTSFAIGPVGRDRIGELAQLPRTRSVALAGSSVTAKGSNAVVWAYGKL